MKLDKKYRQTLRSINGVSLTDYASACAFIDQGFPESLIADVFGISESDWKKILNRWNIKLCKLIASDPHVGTLYGQAYFDPKVGSFSQIYKKKAAEQSLPAIEKVEKVEATATLEKVEATATTEATAAT